MERKISLTYSQTILLVTIKHNSNGIEFVKASAEDACAWKKETVQTQHYALNLLFSSFLDAERIIGFFGMMIFKRPWYWVKVCAECKDKTNQGRKYTMCNHL